MAKLNYQRDLAAAALARRKTYPVTFILPGGSNTFMRHLRQHVDDLRRHAVQDRIMINMIELPPFDHSALIQVLEGVEPGSCAGVAVVATDAPLVRTALDRLVQRGVPVVTLVSDLPSSRRFSYVGIDNSAAGRTAASLLGRFLAGRRGRIAVVAGSMVLRDHMERRLGFEQVMRAEFDRLEILPPLEGLDDSARTEHLLLDLLTNDREVIGVYSLGAGNRGVITALRRISPSRAVKVIAHELTDHAREALLDGTFEAVIHQDPGHEVRSALRLLRSRIHGTPIVATQERIRIEIFLRDNMP